MITNKKFKDKRTGEIVTQFNIMEIGFFEEVEEDDGESDWVYEQIKDKEIMKDVE